MKYKHFKQTLLFKVGSGINLLTQVSHTYRKSVRKKNGSGLLVFGSWLLVLGCWSKIKIVTYQQPTTNNQQPTTNNPQPKLYLYVQELITMDSHRNRRGRWRDSARLCLEGELLPSCPCFQDVVPPGQRQRQRHLMIFLRANLRSEQAVCLCG